ncbi:hypothetical protein Pla123a_34380 [Posidoniimonas polymericola]|uniref:Thiamine-binding protein domain-containing protein n=1 Tax=Posidoniimonas polymericola TaxID=2528002 RepID=A0A5C5YIC3_9BACT|nr:MTH1187 family thiamine-binding protein [Posidoniimonas polymericola]TWT74614.1 hypothetical protein Pla123a_34380 [Posidoniimonas polymericola]
MDAARERCNAVEQRVDSTMVLMELSVVPLGQGESVSQYVAQCVDVIAQSGLDYELNAMGTVVEGELPQLLAIIQQCVDLMSRHSDRVTASVKLDHRAGASGRIRGKVASVETKLAANKNQPG